MEFFLAIATVSFLIEAIVETPSLVWDSVQGKIIWKPIIGFVLGLGFGYATGLDFFAFTSVPVVLVGDVLVAASSVLWGLAFMRGSGFINTLLEKFA